MLAEFLSKNCKDRRHLEDLGVVRRIVIKLILKIVCEHVDWNERPRDEGPKWRSVVTTVIILHVL